MRPFPAANLWMRTDEPLIWLGGAGHEWRRSADYCFDCTQRKDHPHMVLQYTLSGAGFYQRDGRRERISPGMAFLDAIPGDFSYGYPPQEREPYEQMYLNITGPAGEALARMIIAEFGHVLSIGRHSPVESMMRSITHQYASGMLQDRYLISGQLYQLLMTMISCLKSQRVATHPLVREALALMEARGCDPKFNVSQLAEALSCSREHISRQFAVAVGVSAGHYLTQQRLERAARALRQTKDKLDVVASRSGFASATYLCRAFRGRYGITPAEFRRTPWLVLE